jgi:hypothetical protein
MTMEFHEVASIFPLMGGAELAELTADIAEHGLREPIWLHHGQIIDGRNRYLACQKADAEPRFVVWDGKGSLTAFVVSLNLHRRHLTESQRAMVGARIKPMFEDEAKERQGQRTDLKPNIVANWPQGSKSRDQAAAAVNVSPRSVERASVVLRSGIPDLVSAVGSGTIAVSAAAKIAKLPEAEQIEAIAPKPHVANNSGCNEWYTPKAFIDAAVAVMGGIDLDPASSEAANKVVGASNFYSIEDDGLAQPWLGRVFLNPPYASDLVGRFAAKLVEHMECGDVSEAIILVNNATETAWFRAIIGVASVVCFPSARIRFWSPDPAKMGAPLQGQAVIYCGDHAARFDEVFSELGWTATV